MNVSFFSVNLNKELKRRPVNLGDLVLPTLYPNGRKLTQEKIKDITNLLQFVPPIFNCFYTNPETAGEEIPIVSEDEVSQR